MLIIKPQIFCIYPEIVFGFSTKIGKARPLPYNFNLSFSVGDDESLVRENRENYFKTLGLETDHIAFQNQVHSDIVTCVKKGGNCGESDAMITDRYNLGLAVVSADCTPIFIYDKLNKVIAAVHSGWRGTKKNILFKTLIELIEHLGSNAENLIVYIGASICQKYYEVGREVAELFNKKYLVLQNDRYLLNISHANYDILVKFGVRKENIQCSLLCTKELSNLLYSYRRDGKFSGRSLGVIAMRQI